MVNVIDETAVSLLLNIVATNSEKGSSIVFDYFDQSILKGDFKAFGAKEIYEEVKKSDEPFCFGIDPFNIEPFLKDHGLKLVIHHTPKTLEESYLTEDHAFLGHVYGFAYQAVAEVI